MNLASPDRTQTLRAIHGAFRSAHLEGDARALSSRILRELQQQVHPVGVRDVRRARYAEGTELLVDLGDRLGADVYYGGYAEIGELVLLSRVCPDAGTAVDVGANCGYLSVLLAAARRFRGRVIAVEPMIEAGDLLQSNLAAPAHAKVEIRRECLGNADGETDFHVAEESAFSGISDTGRSRIVRIDRVRQLTLDTLLHELGVDSIDILKIDVEGHEADVIEGGMKAFASSPRLVVLAEISGKNLNAERAERMAGSVLRLLSLGFRAWQIDRRTDPIALVPVEHPEAHDRLNGNAFFVRAGSDAEKNLHAQLAALRETPEGRSYFNGYIFPEEAPAEDLVLTAQRLTLRALADEQAQRTGWEQAHAGLKEAYGNLQDTHAALRKDFDKLEQNLRTIEQAYGNLQDTHTALRKDFDKLEQDLRNIEQAYGNLQHTHTALRKDFNKLEQDLRNIEQAYGNLQHTHTALRKDFDKLEQKPRNIEKAHGNLQHTHTALRKDFDKLERKLRTTKEAYGNLQDVHTALRQDFDKLEQKLRKIARSSGK